MQGTDGRTEEPTPKRLREAAERGQLARSAEVGIATSLLAALLVGVALGPAAWRSWHEQMVRLLTLDVTGGDLQALLTGAAARMIVIAVVPVAIGTLLAAVAGNALQVGLKLRPKAAQPKLSRLAPKQGLARLKPATTLWELARTLGKLVLLTAVVWGPLQAWRGQVDDGWTFGAGLAATGSIMATVIVRAVVVAVAVAAADYLWNRRKLRRDLRMTKDEVRRESKEQTGDPLLRARRAERARQMTRNRMLAGVADADAVIVNPTHLAIALRYEPSEPAPRIIAKGADAVALKIIGEARRHGIPITRDIPLARALFRRVTVGDFVPQALFEAVAVVLAAAYRRRGRRPAAAPVVRRRAASPVGVAS